MKEDEVTSIYLEAGCSQQNKETAKKLMNGVRQKNKIKLGP